ncbi:hypothetical protein [Collimonas silvisoli]|uniref:hypothetical protein n=1 Tax=Collimonas silvisoli TaxID=2825884 RepID=UPI001B8BF53E|nr:hypothetical protein [Collimonas silvisoli]
MDDIKKSGTSKVPEKAAKPDQAGAGATPLPQAAAPAAALEAAAPTPAPASAAPDPEAKPQAAAPVPNTELLLLRVQQEQAASMMAQIKSEAEALSPEEMRHLHSHLLANPMHALNETCFKEVDTFRQMSLTFSNLRANSKAFLSIRQDQKAIWSEGGENSRMVGLSFAAGTDPALYLRSFLINAREMILETYQDCSEININLYVRTDQLHLQGRVDLPPGASVTLQSRCDRSSIVGLSSFGVDLE